MMNRLHRSLTSCSGQPCMYSKHIHHPPCSNFDSQDARPSHPESPCKHIQRRRGWSGKSPSITRPCRMSDVQQGQGRSEDTRTMGMNCAIYTKHHPPKTQKARASRLRERVFPVISLRHWTEPSIDSARPGRRAPMTVPSTMSGEPQLCPLQMKPRSYSSQGSKPSLEIIVVLAKPSPMLPMGAS